MGGLGEGTRAGLMARSVAGAAHAREIGGSDLDLVSRAYALAMKPRIALLEDDHDPAYLHPGRSILILLQAQGYAGDSPSPVGPFQLPVAIIPQRPMPFEEPSVS